MRVEESTVVLIRFLYVLIFHQGDAQALKDVGRALVLHRRTVMPYAVYSRKRKGSSDEAEVQQFAELVGQDCAERILLYRSWTQRSLPPNHYTQKHHLFFVCSLKCALMQPHYAHFNTCSCCVGVPNHTFSYILVNNVIKTLLYFRK